MLNILLIMHSERVKEGGRETEGKQWPEVARETATEKQYADGAMVLCLSVAVSRSTSVRSAG